MRPEKLYLLDIIDAADAIQRFCEPVGEEQFLQDELRQSAVLQKLIVIGEAAARLPGDFRARHKEIEWEDIVGFRNIAVHEYFAILWQIVWNTAIQDVPVLRKTIHTILNNEFQGD
jgi:uncharacterized protein with HEPN domain